MNETGPQNGIIGDNFGTDLPEMLVPQDELIDEKKMARFSKTKEFQRLKAHLDERIVFYQGNLPDGRALPETPVTGEDWRVANAIIRELRAVLSAYENANEVVNNQNAGV